MLDAARLDDVVETAVRTLEFAVLAKFAFGLAQSFNALYHAAPILAEERQDVRLWRAAAIEYVRRQLTAAPGGDGHRRARPHVGDWPMPTIAIAPCRQMADYVESIRRAGAEVVELTLAEAARRRGRTGGRRCC